ncbi:MAG: UvrD-helicase domain-containing protein [Clostridia bacterium]|nr:UvrD-helicase domain-containing protein [Clostridia bacterium]
MAEEKKTRYTPEQQAAIDCPGNIIVSASAGSGKTTVMIERLLKAILAGASLDEILCVTFTKKAAANMKEKLRKKLISALGEAEDEATKKHLKEQLAAIPAADISTIHSFCSQLIRRYFYIIGCDGSFDIVSSDDSQFKEYIDRAFENLFDRLYEANDPDFMLLLQFLRRKRRDDSVKSIILDTYFAARAVSHYREKIEASLSIYNPEGFNGICDRLQAAFRDQYQALEDVVFSFQKSFEPYFYCMPGEKILGYAAVFQDMYQTLETAKKAGIFDPIPASISSVRKPVDSKNAPVEVKIAGEYFKSSKEEINRKYRAVRKDIADRDTEYARYIKSGELASAFARILLQFDSEFSAVKKDENKLDYNDLEHFSLELLSNEDVMKEIRSKYKYVFVDEYQDVNPVQEEIISSIQGQIFLVGDVKQAIYGFRGSKSKFFSDKFDTFESRGGSALRIPTNFRSADAVIKAVNDMFSVSMTPTVCGFSYKSPSSAGAEEKDGTVIPDITAGAESLLSSPSLIYAPDSTEGFSVSGPISASRTKKTRSETTDEGTASAAAAARELAEKAALEFISKISATERGHEMKACEGWPAGCGKVTMHIFGEEQKEEIERKVYSVKEDAKEHRETLEAKAIVKLIRSIYGKPRYDKDLKKEVPTQYGDICILARKNKALESIVAALTAAKIPASGAQKGNICDTPEVRQMLDILSVIDNSEQDIALITALLSPLGKFTENDLAVIRTYSKGPAASFRDCCKRYRDHARTPLAAKLKVFYSRLSELQQAAGVLSAGTLITRILSETGLEAEYSANGGEQLRNVLRLMDEGPELTLAGFLRKIRDGGYSIASPACAPSDCVQVMTMHASKGLEFPVVIIADIWKQFTGNGAEDIYFDEAYGFAPRCYNEFDRTYSDTILRKYMRVSISREDIKNELNLFYVACTRAETELDIMASSDTPSYSTASALNARCYANLIDFSSIHREVVFDESSSEPREAVSSEAGTRPEPVATVPGPGSMPEHAAAPSGAGTGAQPASAGTATIPGPSLRPDAEAPQEVIDFDDFFERPYFHRDSINLPVKSSASDILRMNKNLEESADVTKDLFAAADEQDEREWKASDPTGIPRGTAYHRFLELCDFSQVREDQITDEISLFVSHDLMTAEEAAYLSPAELAAILSEPVFRMTDGAHTLREQEFLCRLPACKIMHTTALDTVLVQGAIDLLICREGAYRIVDYKYSRKGPDLLKATYADQLNLYRAAVSRITGVPEEEIPATIVNIHRLYTVEV